MKKILIVDDDDISRNALREVFECEQFEVIEACGGHEAVDLLKKAVPDVAILDMRMPDINGIETLKELKIINGSLPIIMLTGYATIADAVKAVQYGAFDFVEKPPDYDKLIALVNKAIETNSGGNGLSPNHTSYKHSETNVSNNQDEIFFGKSNPSLRIFKHAMFAAENDAPLLLLGESGTGKGMIAKFIHQKSSRADRELVEINCSALSGDLMSRELFGNIRGAFTSADRDNNGLLDKVDGGSLFLDEIGDMDIGCQAKILKVIEEKTYRRVGDTKLLNSDFRLIAATNKNIEEEMQKGTFRLDLYYRMNSIVIHIPPLREWSKDDLTALISHLLSKHNVPLESIGKDKLKILTTYSWPGNIRELNNTLERYVLASRADDIKDDLFPYFVFTALACSSYTRDKHDFERKTINSALATCEGNIDKAAKQLGVSKATLYRKLKQSKNRAAMPVNGQLFN